MIETLKKNIWGLVMAVAGLLAFVAVAKDRFPRIEKDLYAHSQKMEAIERDVQQHDKAVAVIETRLGNLEKLQEKGNRSLEEILLEIRKK